MTHGTGFRTKLGGRLGGGFWGWQSGRLGGGYEGWQGGWHGGGHGGWQGYLPYLDMEEVMYMVGEGAKGKQNFK